MEGIDNEMSDLEQRVRQALDMQGQQFHDVIDQLQVQVIAAEGELVSVRWAGQQEVLISIHENGVDQGLRGTVRYEFGGKVSKPPMYDGTFRDPSTINSWVLRMND